MLGKSEKHQFNGLSILRDALSERLAHWDEVIRRNQDLEGNKENSKMNTTALQIILKFINELNNTEKAYTIENIPSLEDSYRGKATPIARRQQFVEALTGDFGALSGKNYRRIENKPVQVELDHVQKVRVACILEVCDADILNLEFANVIELFIQNISALTQENMQQLMEDQGHTDHVPDLEIDVYITLQVKEGIKIIKLTMGPASTILSQIQNITLNDDVSIGDIYQGFLESARAEMYTDLGKMYDFFIVRNKYFSSPNFIIKHTHKQTIIYDDIKKNFK